MYLIKSSKKKYLINFFYENSVPYPPPSQMQQIHDDFDLGILVQRQEKLRKCTMSSNLMSWLKYYYTNAFGSNDD